MDSSTKTTETLNKHNFVFRFSEPFHVPYWFHSNSNFQLLQEEKHFCSLVIVVVVVNWSAYIFWPQNNHKQLVSAVAALFLRFEYYFCLWLIIWVNCAFASLQRKVNRNLDERKRVLIFGFAPKLRPLIRCVFISFLLPSRQRPSFTDLIWCCCLCASAAFFPA